MAQPLDISMPADLDIGPSYSLRVTAIDAGTGAVVPGVSVGKVVITATAVAGAVDNLQTGEWYLVPGPGA